MTVTIGRRELLAALGGAAAAWPLAGVRSRRECRSLDFSAAQRTARVANATTNLGSWR